MWLSGAPGAGKGVVTEVVADLRCITAPPIVISDLLKGEQVEKLKAKGVLVSDRIVIQILLEEL
jgi:adenylate kinase